MTGAHRALKHQAVQHQAVQHHPRLGFKANGMHALA
jgi:hypothetical protein